MYFRSYKVCYYFIYLSDITKQDVLVQEHNSLYTICLTRILFQSHKNVATFIVSNYHEQETIFLSYKFFCTGS
jgi:hypothetical protein